MRSFKPNKYRFVVIVLLTIMWGVLANLGTASAHTLTHQGVRPHTQLNCLSVSARKVSFDTRTVTNPPGAEWQYVSLIVVTNGCGHIADLGGDVRNSVTCASGLSNSSDSAIQVSGNTSQKTFTFKFTGEGRCVILENGIPVRTVPPTSAVIHVNVFADITSDGSTFSLANADLTFP